MATLPLPADFHNRPPKELAGYSSSVVDDGDDTTAPTGPPGVPDVILPFHAVYGYPVSLPDQPAALIAPAEFVPEWYDASKFTHARLVAHIETAGASGSTVQFQYAPDYPGAPTVFTDAGSPAPVVLPIDQTGALKSPWVRLADGARADVVRRPAFEGGDGATTPVIGKLSAQFRFAAEDIMEKWYLRTGAPTDAGAAGALIQPLDTAALYALLDADPTWNISGASGLFTTYSLPDAGGVGILSLTKGATGTNAGGARTGGSGDIADYICSWCGPPLAGDQVIPSSSVLLYYKEGASLFHSWPTWRVGIWRPGTGIVADWNVAGINAYVGRRFVPLNSYAYALSLVGLGLALTVDGDRFIIGLGMVNENSGGDCFGSVAYNGVNEPVHGTNNASDGASYLLIPKLQYLSYTA